VYFTPAKLHSIFHAGVICPGPMDSALEVCIPTPSTLDVVTHFDALDFVDEEYLQD